MAARVRIATLSMPVSMDCRGFRKNHVAFVDDTLPGIESERMRRHLESCRACAGVDLIVRRSLVIARNNAPRVELSGGFEAGLLWRLEVERFGSKPRTMARAVLPSLSLGALVAVAAAGVVIVTGPERAMGREPSMGLSSPTGPGPSSGARPAFVSSVSTGMAILPALLLVEEVPARFAAEEFNERERKGLTDSVTFR